MHMVHVSITANRHEYVSSYSHDPTET